MTLPQPVRSPPFRVTRASHVVITATDLGRSRAFYVDGLGLAVSDETFDALYLRGVEEAAHHSLVVTRTPGPPLAECVGMRPTRAGAAGACRRSANGISKLRTSRRRAARSGPSTRTVHA